MKKNEKITLILVVSICSLLVIAVWITRICLHETAVKTEVIATISERQYEEAIYPIINNPIKVYQPEKYLVTITYNEFSKTYNNKVLYEQFNEGDDICIILVQNFSQDGELVYQDFVLP